jgi:hypothetical protein
VLPDRHFVQMARAAQDKFKSSVAGALHLWAQGPKLEQVNESAATTSPQAKALYR